MSKHVEKEIKTGLTLEQYDRLCRHFKVENMEKIVQENYYFDTVDATLQQHKWGLRIRLTEQCGEMTVKVPIKKKEKLEITDSFSKEQGHIYVENGTFPKGSVSEQLKTIHVDMAQLVQIGYLKNERYDISHCNKGLFALDKSHFKHGVTYELEYEYNDSDEAFWSLLQQLHIDYTPLPSKMVRAIHAQAN